MSWRNVIFRPTPPLDGNLEGLSERDPKAIGQLISLAENYPDEAIALDKALARFAGSRITPVLGITGTGGSGKSSLVDELVRRYLFDFQDKTLAVISVDPSRRRSGGALLGDRIRMNAIHDPRVYMRSLATRQSNLALSRYVQKSIEICQAADFDLIIVETSGIGQSDTEIVEHSDVSLYVMTAEYGAATQLEKIDMLDFADVIAINKFDKGGSLDALRDVRKQYRRNHVLFDGSDEDLPIFGTVASQFHDLGVNQLYRRLMEVLVAKTQAPFSSSFQLPEAPERHLVIPPDRVRYLAEIVENSEQYDDFVRQQVDIARRMYQLKGTIGQLRAEIGTQTIEIVVCLEPMELSRSSSTRQRSPTISAISSTATTSSNQSLIRIAGNSCVTGPPRASATRPTGIDSRSGAAPSSRISTPSRFPTCGYRRSHYHGTGIGETSCTGC